MAGFSGGSLIAQELALRHPELVRSLVLQSTWPVPDPYLRSWGLFVRWLAEVAPSERAFLEGFFLAIYTPRAHNDGTVDLIIEEVLAFPYKQSTEDLQHYLDAFLDHDTSDRLAVSPASTRAAGPASKRQWARTGIGLPLSSLREPVVPQPTRVVARERSRRRSGLVPSVDPRRRASVSASSRTTTASTDRRHCGRPNRRDR